MTKPALFAVTTSPAAAIASTLIIDPATGEISTPSTTRAALIERYKLPAGASEQDCMDAIQLDLTTKYGLPITATEDEISQKMHEVQCAKYGLDPATTTEAELDAHTADRLLKRAA